MSTEITAQLSKMVFESEDRSFMVGEFLDVKTARRFRASGNLQICTKADLGQSYSLFGDWQNHARYGQTFQTVYCEPVRPDSIAGVVPFLANNVKGVGDATARKLIEHLEARSIHALLDVCRNEPDRIRAFFKSRKEIAENVLAVLTGNEVFRSVMVFLHEHNIPPAFAQRIYDRYGAESLNILRENPYRLISDFRNVGFLRADAIAQKMGIEPTSIFRMEAAFVYGLQNALEDGHCCLPRDLLVQQCCDILGGKHDTRFSFDFVLSQLRAVFKRGRERGEEPFRLRNLPSRENAEKLEPHFYLSDIFAMENEVARRCLDLIAADGIGMEARERRLLESDDALCNLRPEIPWDKLSDEQLAAVRMSVSARIMVLTGGPGCGKTFVLRAIHAVQTALGRKVALCAPTGLAAKRMSLSINAPARTIHKLLGLGHGELLPGTGDAEGLAEADVVIVDEASMLGLELFHILLENLGPNRRLILVGDVDQLPSVNAGNCLRDIIYSGRVKVARLTRIFRQSSESPIPIAAREIISGEKPDLNILTGPEAIQAPEALAFIPCSQGEFMDVLIRLVTGVVPRAYQLDILRDMQILVPVRRGDCGQERVNRELQAVLNPPAPNKTQHTLPSGQIIRVGDKIIQTKNNYQKEVFNGDLGFCKDIVRNGRTVEVHVSFDERLVVLEDEEIEDLQLCYAMTVHKSQGSEFPLCVIPMFGAYHMMLDRNLLYTAITRASRFAVFVGEEWALRRAVRSISSVRRYTGMETLLRSGAAAEFISPL